MARDLSAGPSRRLRPSIRTRLTVLYGGMFFLAGAAVVLASYLLVRTTLTDRLAPAATSVSVTAPLLGEPEVLVGADGSTITPAQLEARIAAEQQALVDDTLSSLLRSSLVALVAIGLLAVGAGYLMAGRVLAPLNRITDTARRVAERSLHECIAMDGPADELKELADTFDAMLERLDAAFDGQRRFVANASHELRTPLAINRTLIEIASGRPGAPPELRQLGDTLLEVNARHERLIDGLLTLASSEHELTGAVPVDLAEIADHVVCEAGTEAANAGVRLQLAGHGADVVGDPVLLERMVQNLVHNGLRYNVADGWVRVETGRDADGAWLAVSNTGPVVPRYETPGCSSRFGASAATDWPVAAAPDSACPSCGRSARPTAARWWPHHATAVG